MAISCVLGDRRRRPLLFVRVTVPGGPPMRHLSLVPTTAAPECAAERPVAFVPVKLLLAASGRCSCDDCCRAALAARGSVRPARGTDRQPVRNVHLLS